MDLYPAIDILDGKAVRLRQGQFDDRSVYANDPVSSAERWVGEGARRLHVVDLDGARAGRPASIDHLRRICNRVPVAVQYGGGLRSIENVEQAFDAGAHRVVIGTAAFADAALLDGAIQRWGDRVSVAVDVRGGVVSTSGWTEQSQLDAAGAIAALRDRGVRRLVYTNVDRDGMLSGPDVDEITRVCDLAAGEEIIYSGGIGALDDLAMLVAQRPPNLVGVIVGKALYEGRFALSDALRLFDGSEVGRSS